MPSFDPSTGRPLRRRLLASLTVVLGLSMAAFAVAQDAAPAPETAYDEATVERGLQVFRDGGCRACHGWAANGVREGENIEGPSIRQTMLTPELIRLTVKCGRPNAMMPFYDHQAYNLDERCYGISRFNVGNIALPPRGRTSYSDEQLDDLIAYLMARVVGLPDEPTLEQCILFFGPGANNCTLYE